MNGKPDPIPSAEPLNPATGQAVMWLSGTIPAAPPWEGTPKDRLTLLDLTNVLLKRWKTVAGIPFAMTVLAVVLVLILPSKYTAMATFMPEADAASRRTPGIAGLAAGFGVRVPGLDNSALLYGSLLRSRTIEDSVLLTVFPDPRTGQTGARATLLDILEVEGPTLDERLEDAREGIPGFVSVGVNGTVNIVEVSVTTRYPELSAAVANRYVELLNSFNYGTRQSTGRARRQFVEGRLMSADQELQDAEAELRRFLERNRLFEQSPELRVAHQGLQRQIRFKEEVVATLRREYEEARIQEVNDTPLITVIDRAKVPERKSSPRRRATVILALILGIALGMFVPFVQEYLARAREREDERFQEAGTRLRQIRQDLRSLLRLGRPAHHT